MSWHNREHLKYDSSQNVKHEWDFDITAAEFVLYFHDCFSSFCITGKNSNATDMGKKGSWFSAIKRVFTHHSKEKVPNVSAFLLFCIEKCEMLDFLLGMLLFLLLCLVFFWHPH